MPSSPPTGDPAFPSNPNAVQLIIKGSEYRNWYSFDIDSDVFTEADAFEVRAKVPSKSIRKDFREGESLDVYLGDDRVMPGVIDEVDTEVTKGQSAIVLRGRDQAAWLLDSEAETLKLKGLTLKTLAEKLLKPEWGVREVVVSNEDNRKKLLGKKDRKTKKGTSLGGAPLYTDHGRNVKIDPGRRVWAVLQEQAEHLGVAMWLTAAGQLFIGKPNYKQEPSYKFVCYEGGELARKHNNCRIRLSRSMGARCSHLEVWGQGKGNARSSGGGVFSSSSSAKNVKFVGKATDPDLVARKIKRKVILVDNLIRTKQQAQTRADSEMGRRRLSGFKMTIEVDSFLQDGSLFAADTLAEVKFEEGDIDGIYWIPQRRFLGSRKADLTTLTALEKGVWLP